MEGDALAPVAVFVNALTGCVSRPGISVCFTKLGNAVNGALHQTTRPNDHLAASAACLGRLSRKRKVKPKIPDIKYSPRLFGRNRSIGCGMSNSFIALNGQIVVLVALAAASSINAFVLVVIS